MTLLGAGRQVPYRDMRTSSISMQISGKRAMSLVYSLSAKTASSCQFSPTILKKYSHHARVELRPG